MFLRRALVLGTGTLASAISQALSGVRDLVVANASDLDLTDASGTRERVADCNVVVSAAPRQLGALVLRTVIEADRLVVDAATPIAEALPLHECAVEHEVAACVGCDGDGLERLLGRPAAAARADERLTALLAASLARRLLTGDFRGHWGVWTPEKLAARVGMAHGIAQDLRERGIQV